MIKLKVNMLLNNPFNFNVIICVTCSGAKIYIYQILD